MPSNYPMTPTDLPIEFWNILGLDPATFEKIVITIETRKAIKVEISQTLPSYRPE